MSFWWYGRKRNGRRYLWQIDTDPLAVMMMAAFIVVVIALNLLANPSKAVFLISALLAGGFACLLMAKISLFRQKIWLSFGPGRMSRGYARLYKVAYVLMGLGALVMLLLWSAIRIAR